MLGEAREAPAAVARLLERGEAVAQEVASSLRAQPPRGIVTVARGSSDHAAHYLGYLVMARLGRLVTSLPMSLVTLYASRLDCEGLVSFAFSQSGQSPDLLAPTLSFAARGARTAAFVNDAASPLAQASGWVLDLHAGPETSVAATKSFLAQMTASARLLALWEEASPLRAALRTLPQDLQQALACDWSAALQPLAAVQRLYVVSRGTGLAVAMEAALKLKELCGIQAEAFSGAELRHGPMALVQAGYPLLVLAPRGPAQPGLLALAAELRGRGAHVLLAAPAGTPGAELPLALTGHEDLDPIAVAQSLYPMVEALARLRGYDPDAPPNLAKVTRTA